MKRQQVLRFLESWRKGQSLVELTLVLTLLLTLLVGMVEFGNLLNQYITVVDAAREGARFGSNDDPFIRTVVPGVCASPVCVSADFFIKIDQIVEGTLKDDPTKAGGIKTGIIRDSKGALSPIVLRPALGDDVIISFFSINRGVPKRFPVLSGDDGWSYYRDYYTLKGETPFAGKKSALSTSDMASRMSTSDPAPDTGMVLVEVYYHYSQILGLWTFIRSNNDPIEVHSYAVMPLSAAEPTPTP